MLCAEVICHGVPSPAVWRSYLAYVENSLYAPVKAVYFRDKSINWHKYALNIDCGKEKFLQCHKESPFMQLFLKELISRKSCSDCQFKSGKSSADLSLGDFWNLHKFDPQLDNSTGASMVIVHTESGMSALKKCNWAHFKQLPMECVKICNRAYSESMQAHPNRDKYFAEFAAANQCWVTPDKYIAKKCKKSFFSRIKTFFVRKNSK